jgi:hypothetical protein
MNADYQYYSGSYSPDKASQSQYAPSELPALDRRGYELPDNPRLSAI